MEIFSPLGVLKHDSGDYSEAEKDTLCGTKVLWKEDYEAIAANRAYFGDFDPFGDFDLIFGAVKLNLKITDLPISRTHLWHHKRSTLEARLAAAENDHIRGQAPQICIG